MPAARILGLLAGATLAYGALRWIDRRRAAAPPGTVPADGAAPVLPQSQTLSATRAISRTGSGGATLAAPRPLLASTSALRNPGIAAAPLPSLVDRAAAAISDAAAAVTGAVTNLTGGSDTPRTYNSTSALRNPGIAAPPQSLFDRIKDFFL